MSGYTPSEEEVRGYITEHKFREFGERFDRFLAEDRRKTAARALQAAADDLWDESTTEDALNVVGWLRARANAIEKGASDDQS